MSAPSNTGSQKVVLYRLRASITLATDDTGKPTIVPLVKSVFGGASGAFPILCGSHKYNVDYLKTKPYDTRVSILFDRNHITKYLLPSDLGVGTDVEQKAKENEVLSYNFVNMLALLFPTSIPTMNGVHMSSQVMPMPETPSWYTRNTGYSYLTVGGHKYTVTGTTWVNDVGNNPRYAEVIRACRVFAAWRQKLIDPNNWNQTHDAFVTFDANVRQAIQKKSITFEPIPPTPTGRSTLDVNSTEFSKAMEDIRQYFYMDSPPPVPLPSHESNVDNIAKLLNAMKTLKNTNAQIEKQTIRSESDKAILYAIVKLKKFMGAYDLVDKQEMAIGNIKSVNLRYADNPDMTTYIPAKYPQFISFTNAIHAFYGKYIPGNPVWGRIFTSLVQTTATSGIDILANLLDIADNYNSPLSYVYFDEEKVTSVPDREKEPSAERENADLNMMVVELQMDVIDGEITEDNMGDIICPFKDHLLGLSFARLSIPAAARWRIPAPSYFSAVQFLSNAKSKIPNTTSNPAKGNDGQKENPRVAAPLVNKKQGGNRNYKSMRHSRIVSQSTQRRK